MPILNELSKLRCKKFTILHFRGEYVFCRTRTTIKMKTSVYNVLETAKDAVWKLRC